MSLIFKENIEIEKVNISVRAYNCLKRSSINKLYELMALSDDDLIKIRNLGEKSLEEINKLKRSVEDGIIPLKDIIYDNLNNLNFNDTKLIDALSVEGKEREDVFFYNSYGGYVDDLSIKDLNLSVRSRNALRNAGFNYISELLELTYIEFNAIRNLGKKSREEILRLIKECIYITYKVKDKSKNSVINLEKYLEWIIDDFRDGKINFNLTNFRANIIPNLKRVANEDCLEGNDVKNFLTEDYIYVIYENKFFISLFRSEIIRNINNIGGQSTIKDIVNFFPNHIKKTNYVLNLVNDMIKENIIEKFEGKYSAYYPPLAEIIDNIADKRDKLIIENRLLGKTLEEVGNMLNISRERVRQKEVKIMRKIPRVKEDRFQNVFESYDWSTEVFLHAFEVNIEVYNYLNYKYKKGTVELNKVLEDNTIPVKVRQRVESLIYKNYLLIGNVRIKKEKQHILDYVLQSFCKDDISVKDLRDIYVMFLEDFNLDIEEFNFPDRYFESTLARSNKVLWKFKKRLRYFDFTEFDSQKIISSLCLENYKNVEISALKIFNDYNEVMKEWGIKDEYELHNLMKKVIGDKNSLGIKFLRMPNIEFGDADRDMQVLELLIQTAPIQNYELAKLYEREYGVKAETALSNCFKAIEEYFHDGMYSIDYKCLNQDELDKMKEILNDDIYLLSEVKELFKSNFPQGDIEKINPYSLRCLDFKVTSLLIYSDRFNSLEDCVKEKIVNNEIFDATDLMKRFGNCQSFYNVIRDKKFEYEIVEFEPNIFITKERLEKNGITKNDLLDFVKSVDDFIDEEIFTIKYLRKRGFEHYLDTLGFDEWFYSSILKCNEKYKSRRIDCNIILKKSNDVVTLNDLVEHIVTKFKKIDIYDLIDYTYKTYGVRINRGKVPQIAREKELYYDAIMEKIYIDYDEYFEEV
ncbi:MAG: hypothetical protein GX275_03300 [Clostridiales bacterium]|nr:hypothetical protein [Clostridiales bacterium]